MQLRQGFVSFPTAYVLIDIFFKVYASMCLNQRLIRPRIIGYKYTNSISVKDSTDLRKPLGVSGKRSRENVHRIARWIGSL